MLQVDKLQHEKTRPDYVEMLQVDILQHVTTATLTLSDIDDVHLSL